MIVEFLLNALQSLLTNLFSFINIPMFSEEVVGYLYDFLDILDHAKAFISFFIPPAVFNTLFPVFSAMFIINHGYPLIMWIVRKIPVSID